MTDHVETVRRAYAAFSAGDLDGALAAMADDVEWHQAQGLPHGGVYRGLAEVRASVFGPIEGGWWDGFDAVPEQIAGLGDVVLAVGRYTATARATGRPLDVPYAHVWEFAGGRCVRFRQFTDTRGWVDALGL